MNSVQNEAPSARNFTGLTIVVGLHVLVAYAIVTNSTQKYFRVTNAASVLKIVDQKPPPKLEPLKEMPQKWANPITPYVPAPEITIAQPVESTPVFAHVSQAPPESREMPIYVSSKPIEEAERSGPGLVGPVLVTDGCESLDYPWAAQKERQQGSVLLMLLIDANGRASQSKVIGSSGYPALDEKARAGIAMCKFKPGTEHGVPTPFWKKLRYIWELHY